MKEIKSGRRKERKNHYHKLDYSASDSFANYEISLKTESTLQQCENHGLQFQVLI